VTGHLLCNEFAPHKVNAAAYTKIYARISAGPQALGANMPACGRMSVTPH